MACPKAVDEIVGWYNDDDLNFINENNRWKPHWIIHSEALLYYIGKEKIMNIINYITL